MASGGFRLLNRISPGFSLSVRGAEQLHGRSPGIGHKSSPSQEPVVSVVVPARNEAGNIENIFRRVPEMGAGTELIFVEGNSTDDTYRAIEAARANHSERNSKLLKQPGKGKGDAVRTGFSAARGEILMILDADLTVPPEDLPRFYEALRSGKGEFINGVRLVYPMEQRAMRFFNLIANKFFSIAFSWLLGQPIKDTLCGTKVLRKTDYEMIAGNRHYFGDLILSETSICSSAPPSSISNWSIFPSATPSVLMDRAISRAGRVAWCYCG